MFSLETLQFNKLLSLIAKNAQTPMGEDFVLEMKPHTSRLQLEKDLAAIAEIFALKEADVIWRFSELTDPSNAISLLKIRNSSLEPTILRELARLLSQALFAKNAIQAEKEIAPTLWELVENLPKHLNDTAEKINKKILPSGELDDSASPELTRLRREINAQRGRLTKSLEDLMRSKSNAIQDEIVTVRNERFVIPVKADFSGKINGVAHGASSSGATIFIEPLESIEANNELQKLKAKEESEIARILFSLAEELRQNLPAVEIAVEAVGELDFVKTKTIFAEKFNAIVPTISEDEILDLVEARHPLLEENFRKSFPQRSKGAKEEETNPKSKIQNPKSDIVPVSFSLNKQNSVMIISGANAGGKTVVLKTAGLLSLMAVSGLPVPAKSAKIPFYASVLADIGDNQSLSANLSTFSSHISNIASMIKNLNTPALVLLDEVGTGTDPEEGSALGVAVVDHFRNHNAQVIASTHYKGLKIYATNDADVINASVEFDEKTLQPTYKLLTGIAGASSGLEIARRFGIRDEVIKKARENLDAAAQVAEDYLHKLQKETKLATDLRVALEEERQATAEKYASLDIDFRKKENQRRREFQNELDQIITDFDKQSKEFLKTVKDKKERKKLEKDLQANKAKLKREALKIDAATQKHENAENKSELRAVASGSDVNKNQTQKNKISQTFENNEPKTTNKPIENGSQVLLKNFGTIGKVEKINGKNADVLVGSMRMKQKLDDLQTVEVSQKQSKKKLENLQKKAKESNIDMALGGVQSELNLIGKTTLDAEDEIDKFLDDSFVNKMHQVRIIHGFGTGVLKNFVHQFLKGHPHVSSFGFAPQNEGGNGATIVELKQ
ncbi:MAG: endonuclease MutS2 [Aridibacter sp.]